VVVALTLGIVYNYPATAVKEICTVVSYTHSYSYNPIDNTSYVYRNTTIVSTVEIYNNNIVQTQSTESNVTVNGTTLTASGYPGVSWNETICAFASSTP